jgi:hypothetical protein
MSFELEQLRTSEYEESTNFCINSRLGSHLETVKSLRESTTGTPDN